MTKSVALAEEPQRPCRHANKVFVGLEQINLDAKLALEGDWAGLVEEFIYACPECGKTIREIR